MENIFGFVENHRDPSGARAEFESVVTIPDREETSVLTRLVQQSSVFIKQLPWTEGFSDNQGKGPFKKNLFEPPDLTSIHALANCSNTIFRGINLPNYNGIRHFNVEAEKWGEAHSRASFAILKCLLRDGNGLMKIHCDSQKNQLIISVDRDISGQCLTTTEFSGCCASAWPCG